MPGGITENFLFILLPPVFPIPNKQKNSVSPLKMIKLRREETTSRLSI